MQIFQERQRWKVKLLLVIGNDCGCNLHSQQVEDALLFTHPADGTGNHIKDHLNIESGLSLGLSVSINAEGVQPEHIQVRRPNGEFHPVVIDVFYGQDSHIINIEPLEDWSDGVHHVIISQDLASDGFANIG